MLPILRFTSEGKNRAGKRSIVFKPRLIERRSSIKARWRMSLKVIALCPFCDHEEELEAGMIYQLLCPKCVLEGMNVQMEYHELIIEGEDLEDA
jgi:hypothetical protein